MRHGELRSLKWANKYLSCFLDVWQTECENLLPKVSSTHLRCWKQCSHKRPGQWMGPTSHQSIFDISSFSVVAVTYMSTPTLLLYFYDLPLRKQAETFLNRPGRGVDLSDRVPLVDIIQVIPLLSLGILVPSILAPQDIESQLKLRQKNAKCQIPNANSMVLQRKKHYFPSFFWLEVQLCNLFQFLFLFVMFYAGWWRMWVNSAGPGNMGPGWRSCGNNLCMFSFYFGRDSSFFSCFSCLLQQCNVWFLVWRCSEFVSQLILWTGWVSVKKTTCSSSAWPPRSSESSVKEAGGRLVDVFFCGHRFWGVALQKERMEKDGKVWSYKVIRKLIRNGKLSIMVRDDTRSELLNIIFLFVALVSTPGKHRHGVYSRLGDKWRILTRERWRFWRNRVEESYVHWGVVPDFGC